MVFTKCDSKKNHGCVCLGAVAFLVLSTVGTSLGSTQGLAGQAFKASSGIHQFTHDVIDRVKAASTTPVSEPADAVLIRTKEWKWNRYVRSALNLPDWMDLGLEHRTRFGVYDHPWRSNQPLGRTDP